MADLTAIRALLSAVEGFTPGPWRVAYTAGQGRIDSCKVYTDAIGERPFCIGDVNHYRYVPADQQLFAAAPTLYAHLTEAADEIERLRAEVATLTAHRDRMAAAWLKMADACDDAHDADLHDSDAADPLFDAMPGPAGGDWPDIRDAIRALAAGEVDDGR